MSLFPQLTQDGYDIRTPDGKLFATVFARLNEKYESTEATQAEAAAMANIIINRMNSYEQLLAGAKAQHQAIDILMAALAKADPNFMPSKSPAWPYMAEGHAAILYAEGDLTHRSAIDDVKSLWFPEGA